ncbi:MAG: ATP-binding protein, partial [Chthoniobacteraceae bacterium]
FVLYLTILILPAVYLAFNVKHQLETSYLQSTEEGMIDVAAVVAELYTRLIKQYGENSPKLKTEIASAYTNLDQTYQIKARLFGYTKKEMDTRLLVYDAKGSLIFDTADVIPVGTDLSDWSDVGEALRGRYGARWELENANHRVNLYSTLPVFINGKVAGAVSVSKPTNRIRNFIANSFEHILIPCVVVIVLTAGLIYLLSSYLTRVVADLAFRADRIAEGEPGVRIETWTKSEFGTLARAVEKMRRKLEGKAYVEEMAANLSHELKTPLAAIRGAAEVLEDGAINDPAARTKFLTNIQSEVGRLDRVVNDLLKLSRIEMQPVEESDVCDVTAAMRDVAVAYEKRASSFGVKFGSDIPDAPLRARISTEQVAQAVGNLLDNAFYFTPPDKRVTLSLASSNGTVEIRVGDEGAGIEAELLPKIFDRFFTTENPRSGARGSGLGLAIAKSIVTRHGGQILVKSVSGKGSEFRVCFPLA